MSAYDEAWRQPESGVYCSRCGRERTAFFNGRPAECRWSKCPSQKHDLQSERNHDALRALVEEALAPVSCFATSNGVMVHWLTKAKAALGK